VQVQAVVYSGLQILRIAFRIGGFGPAAMRVFNSKLVPSLRL
jgi:hypothetical protein